MPTHLRSRHLALALVFLACGPKLPADDTDTGDDETTTAAATGSAASTSGADPGSTGSTGAPTTGGADATTGTSTGCSFLGCDTGGDSGPQCLVVDGQVRCSECDPWTQDCPEGQKCMPWANDGGNSWNALKCTEVMPNAGKPGDECTVEGSGVSGVDSCEKGAMCWNVSQETGKGTCVAFCTGSPEAPMCADPDSFCAIANDGVLTLCFPNCDPLLQDCPGTDVCIPNPNGGNFLCVLDASGDLGKQNDPCEYANACDPGLVCVDPALASECDPMAAGCCLPFCDLMNPDCTNQGAMCLPWYEMNMAPPGYENVGVCGLMQ